MNQKNNEIKNSAMRSSNKLVFNTQNNSNDLDGTLKANIKFAQSQIIPVTPKENDHQPHLISRRDTLVLVKPLDNVDALQVSLTDRNGTLLGALSLNPPSDLPNTSYTLPSIPDDFDFTPLPGTTSVISSQSDLNNLAQTTGDFLLERLRQNSVVHIKTANGSWTANIYLP